VTHSALLFRLKGLRWRLYDEGGAKPVNSLAAESVTAGSQRWKRCPRVPALRDFSQVVLQIAAQLFDPDISWSVDGPDPLLARRLTSDQRRHLYLLIKESLTNAHRHAQASSVAVRVSNADAGLQVEVEDDGTGTEVPTAREGNGFANMRARAAALGGTVTVGGRTPEPGTRVVIQTGIH